MSVHPTAIVAEGAVVPPSCTVGPFCTVGPDVVLGEDCVLVSHVVLDGHLRAGRANRFAPFCALGVPPQDLKYAGEPTGLRLGDNNSAGPRAAAAPHASDRAASSWLTCTSGTTR